MRFVKTKNGSGPTRFLHVSGAGSSLGTSKDTIRDVFSLYGAVDIVFIDDKRFCFVVYLGMINFFFVSHMETLHSYQLFVVLRIKCRKWLLC